MDLTHEEKLVKKQIVRDELKGKIKHLYMSFLSEKETQYPPWLNKEDVINVLSSLILEETMIEKVENSNEAQKPELGISDVRTRNFMIRDRARLMKEAYTNLGKRDTEWEKEYFKGILTLVDDIMKLTE